MDVSFFEKTYLAECLEIDQTSSADGYAKLQCGLAIDLSRRYAVCFSRKNWPAKGNVEI
jgi:hypothetical protein